jgi:hypothetical protein
MLELPDDLLERLISTEYFVLTRWRDHKIPAGLQEDTVYGGGG